MSRRRFYVTQYEVVYSMSKETYLTFLHAGATQGWYDLSRIPGVRVIGMNPRLAISYYDAIEPLDWRHEDFIEELQRF